MPRSTKPGAGNKSSLRGDAVTTDCLIIGYNDGDLTHEVEMMRAMGADHPDYRDLSLNFIQYQGRPYRAMDILDHFYY
jgi:hypothetical protein